MIPITVYARSDVSGVTISGAHGGCGQTHSRPVSNGAPQDIWFVTCPQCESYLRSDPCWSTVPDSVPETPDEVTAREERQKRTDTDTQRLMSQAVTQLPEILAQMVAGNTELMKQFVDLARAKGTLPDMTPAKVTEGQVISRARELPSNDLESLSVVQLKALAKERGISVPVSQRDKASLLRLLSQKVG